MSADPENFEALRKLLTLKRHETPPPGYFDQLAGEVRARLRGGAPIEEHLWRELGDEASWVQRLWNTLSNRPALAGAFGMLLCGVALTMGIHYSMDNGADLKSQSVAQNASLPSQALAPQLALGQTATTTSSSGTNPMTATPPAGLFDQIPGQAREVNFSPASP